MCNVCEKKKEDAFVCEHPRVRKVDVDDTHVCL